MPWKHMDVACAECGKQVRSRPCEVVSHTESALQSAIDEMKNEYDCRVNFIGKDGVFVDDVLYMKKPK